MLEQKNVTALRASLIPASKCPTLPPIWNYSEPKKCKVLPGWCEWYWYTSYVHIFPAFQWCYGLGLLEVECPHSAWDFRWLKSTGAPSCLGPCWLIATTINHHAGSKIIMIQFLPGAAFNVAPKINIKPYKNHQVLLYALHLKKHKHISKTYPKHIQNISKTYPKHGKIPP